MSLLIPGNSFQYESIRTRYLLLSGAVFCLLISFSGNGWANEKLALLDAARDGNLKQVELLINEGADVNQADESGYTPLMWAARYGHLDIAKRLVNAGALIGVKNNNEVNAIQIASRFNSFRIARFLNNLYFPNQEYMTTAADEDTSQQDREYDSDDDGYLDSKYPEPERSKEVVYGTIVDPEFIEFDILEDLPKCSKNKFYKIISAKWALHRNKWRDITSLNDSVVRARHKRYKIELNFFTENNQEVMGVRYAKKQGRLKHLKRVAKRALETYQFLCAVPELSDRKFSEYHLRRSENDFMVPKCSDPEHAATAIVLISLRDSRWKNIRVSNGNSIRADHITKKIRSSAIIHLFDDWHAGIISIGSSDIDENFISNEDYESDLMPEDEAWYRKRLKTRIKRKVTKLNKLVCN